MNSMAGLSPFNNILGSNPNYSAMEDASKDNANVQASAAAVYVVLQIQDTKQSAWMSARFVLRDDKRHLLRAEVFIAAITGAFTALIKGGKFTVSRTSLSNDSIVIKAAEDAARAKIEEIKIRKAEKARLETEKNVQKYYPVQGSNKNRDGANFRSNSDLSIKTEPNSDDNHDDDASFNLMPNPPIQRNNYTFWPPLPEDIDATSSNAAKIAHANVEKTKKPMCAAEIAAQFIYRSADPSVEDSRHPTVIEHERKTGIKNVVGTGLNGKLTRRDIMEAATNVDNLPEDIKTIFMSRSEDVEYWEKKAAEVEVAVTVAQKAVGAAETNQREKLKIAAGANDSEQDNIVLKQTSQKSLPPMFDPQNRLLAFSETPRLATHNPLRKSKNRSVVPGSDSDDTPPFQDAFNVFDDADTPENFKARRASRHSSNGSVRVARNGSPIASLPPHELRLGVSARWTSPAADINDIAKKLARPPVPKKFNKLDMRQSLREDTEETEELVQRSSPNAITSAPRAVVKTKPPVLSRELNQLRKTQALSTASHDSLGALANDPSLFGSRPQPVASKKRRRESTASEETDPSPYFQQPPAPKRGKQSKLHQHAVHHSMSTRSTSPAVCVVSTAASERPRRVKKSAQPRQSLPAQSSSHRRMSADRPLMAAPVVAKKSTQAKKSKVSIRTKAFDEMGETEMKAKDEEIIKKPVAVTDEEFDVEAIVGHKLYEGRTYYRVKWEGYSEDKNTWEPAGNLHDAHKILNEYRSSLHKNHEIESILAHRRAYIGSIHSKPMYEYQYRVKWKNSNNGCNSWETEESIRGKGRDATKLVIYYRIKTCAAFGGNGRWSKASKAAAVQMLKEAGLKPEDGGKITAADMKSFVKDEDDDRDELALSARRSGYESAKEDFSMNQTI